MGESEAPSTLTYISAAVAFVLLLPLHVLIKLVRPTTLAALRRLPILGSPPNFPVSRGKEIGRGVSGAARRLRLDRRSCIARSSLTFAISRLVGLDPVLYVGARSLGTSLTTGIDAHVWVEIDGVPVDDTADVADRYPAFDAPLIGTRS